MKPEQSAVAWFLGIDPKYWPWLAVIAGSVAIIVILFKIDSFLKFAKVVGGVFSLFKKEVTSPKQEPTPNALSIAGGGLRVVEGAFFKTTEHYLCFSDTVRPSPQQEESLLRLLKIYLHVLSKRPTAGKRLTLDLSLVEKHNSGLIRLMITLIEFAIEQHPDVELHLLLAKEPITSLATAADVWKGQIKAIEVKKGEGYVSIVAITHKQ